MKFLNKLNVFGRLRGLEGAELVQDRLIRGSSEDAQAEIDALKKLCAKQQEQIDTLHGRFETLTSKEWTAIIATTRALEERANH